LWSFLAVALEVDLNANPAEVEHLRPYLERLQAARPRSGFPVWQLGRYHYLRNDYSSARHYLEQVTGHLASSPRLLNLRAACSERLGDHIGALDQYRRSLAQDPAQADIHFRIGRVLLHAYLESFLWT
jgi:Tfp pilus assembly protein PilF